MSDLPPDLPRLRTLEQWHTMWLTRIRTAITAAEQHEATAAAEKARREQQRPPVPEWVVQLGIGVGAPPVAVHVGGCAVVGKRHKGVAQEQALQLLAAGTAACHLCRPDTELGFLG